MFQNLGYQWAGSLLAFLSILLLPIPFVLSRWGRELRKKGSWAREHMDDLENEEVEAMGMDIGVTRTADG